jgi:thiamine pyrophosphokinase
MNETVIVVTGAAQLDEDAVAEVPHDAIVIAADGALDHALAAGLTPAGLVGDLDSVSPEGLAWAQHHATIAQHDPDKDHTDTELALQVALDFAPCRLILLSGGGDRLDHSLAAIGALGHPSLTSIPEIDGWWGDQRFHVLHGPGKLSLEVEAAFADFTAETGIEVELLVAGDAGTMLSKAALTAGNPEGDVMWGVDNTLLSRAIDAEVFEPYVASGVDALAPELTALVPERRGHTGRLRRRVRQLRHRCARSRGHRPPTSIADLALPEYASRLVVQNPASSSPGLAFLMATIAELGDGWEQFWVDCATATSS